MKLLPTGNDTPQWDKSLLNDIAFIKRYLRYPIARNRILPVIFWGVLLGIFAISSYALYVYQQKAKTHSSFSTVLLISNIVLYSILIGRYIQTLRFISIPTEFYVGQNQQLIQKFLQAQRLLIFRHPDAPEVFQILSKNLSAGKEDREVIIFIADDKRILINSHFTNQGWGFSPGTRHHKGMAKELKDYIDRISTISKTSKVSHR